MLVLVLDTSTPAVTAAVAEVPVDVPADGWGGVVRAERRTEDARAHAELLAPQVADVLAEAGAGPREIAAIVAGLGPGPFTGLRVGLVTAAAMGQALGIPTYGVCSLDALGLAAAQAGPGRVLVATDARRREVYHATYADGTRLGGPDVSRPATLAGTADRAVGDGALAYAEVLGLPVDAGLRHPPAWALAALAAERVRAGAPGERLVPLYLRRPDAVEPAARKPAPAMTVRLRRLRWWDIAPVMVIEEDLFGPEKWSPAMFWNELASRHHYLVAADADTVQGYAGLAVTAPDESWVQNIAVRRSAQRLGVGRALLEALLAEASRRRVPKVLLEVAVDNAPAQRLYATYDFEPVGVRRGYYQPSNTDALVMMRSA